MTLLTEKVNSYFTPEDLLKISSEHYAAAIQNALVQYSSEYPREVMKVCELDGMKVLLPEEWVEGFSTPLVVNFPVSASIDEDFKTKKTFTVDDWVLNAGQYVLSISHGMNDIDVDIHLKDESDSSVYATINVISANTIEIIVPVEPDSRFSGSAIFIKVI